MLHVCQIFLPLAYIHGKRMRIGLYEYSSPIFGAYWKMFIP